MTSASGARSASSGTVTSTRALAQRAQLRGHLAVGRGRVHARHGAAGGHRAERHAGPGRDVGRPQRQHVTAAEAARRQRAGHVLDALGQRDAVPVSPSTSVPPPRSMSVGTVSEHIAYLLLHVSKRYTSALTRVKYRAVSRDPGARPRSGLAARARARARRRVGEGHRRRRGRLPPARLLPLRQPRRAADGDGPASRRAQRVRARGRGRRARSRRSCAPGATTCPEILPVARALEAALVAGDEGGSAWRDRMAELHAIFARAVAGLDLADGWTAGPRRRLDLGARAALGLRPPGPGARVDAAPSSRSARSPGCSVSSSRSSADHLPGGAAGLEHR